MFPDAKMVRFKKGKPNKQGNSKKQPAVVLQELLNEEANLVEEKKNLADLRQKLQSKVQEEINSRKNSIKKLRTEITDLKFSCEEFTKSLKKLSQNRECSDEAD
jgi:hypothetical protein